MTGGSGSVRRSWAVVAAMGVALGLILLDETIVGVALPTIRRDLDLSSAQANWVINAYMLALSCVTALSGKLGDALGMRNLATTGTTIFGLASLACGFADSGLTLLAARAAQGIGGSVLLICSVTMVAEAVPSEKHGLALGVRSALASTAFALGPLIGGAFTEKVDWRWIFWINPILCAPILAVVWLAWEETPNARERLDVDGWGTILLVASVGLLVTGLMQGPDWGWNAWKVWVALGLGGLLALLFVLTELRVARPLIELDLFANREFASINVVLFFTQFSKLAVVVFAALYLQEVLGMMPLAAGIALLPAAAPNLVVPPIAGRLADRLGPRWPIRLGLLGQIVALAWLGWAVQRQHYAWVATGLALWGVSIPMLWSPSLQAVMAAVGPEKRGQATGVIATARLLGGVAGVAVSGIIVASTKDYSPIYFASAGLAAVALLASSLGLRQRMSAGAEPNLR